MPRLRPRRLKPAGPLSRGRERLRVAETARRRGRAGSSERVAGRTGDAWVAVRVTLRFILVRALPSGDGAPPGCHIAWSGSPWRIRLKALGSRFLGVPLLFSRSTPSIARAQKARWSVDRVSGSRSAPRGRGDDARQCQQIIRRDGAVVGFSDHVGRLEVDRVTYRSAPRLTLRSTISTSRAFSPTESRQRTCRPT